MRQQESADKRVAKRTRKLANTNKRKKEKISNKKNTKTISSEQDFTDTAMQITRIHKHMHTMRYSATRNEDELKRRTQRQQQKMPCSNEKPISIP